MRIKKLIKEFIFEGNRSRIELGTDTRLNPETKNIQLKEQSQTVALYPLDDDLYVRTWIANPQSCKRWSGFDVEISNKSNDQNEVVTSAGYRLNDGTDDYWHDGADWVVNTTDWNTEEEVALNIGDFPITSKKIQVVINLKTTDNIYTPEILKIKVLYDSNVIHHEDYIIKTLIPHMKNNIRPISFHSFYAETDLTTIDLANEYPIENPYTIAGINAVFNTTDDPNRDNDLFLSYDENTKIITLSETILTGKSVSVEFLYQPIVAVSTSEDYTEIGSIPSIILSDIELFKKQNDTFDYVRNKGDGTAVKIFTPIQGDFSIELESHTSLQRDHVHLSDEIKRFFENNKFMTTTGTDEDFRTELIEPYFKAFDKDENSIHVGRFRIKLYNVLFFERDYTDAFIVQDFNLSGDMDITIGG